MIRYLSVDAGKADTKIAVRDNRTGEITTTKFPTKVLECLAGDAFENAFGIGPDSYRLSLDGKEYLVGSAVTEEMGQTTNQNSKMDYFHKTAIYTAIGTQVNDGDSVYVAIGAPIKCCLDKEQCEDFKHYLFPDNIVEFTINGIKKKITISKISVFPESMGAAFLYPELFGGQVVGVIDIGGLNVNGSIYDNNKIVREQCFTAQFGRRVLVDEIKAEIERENRTEYQTYEIEQFIRQGYITNQDERMEEASKGFIEEFVTRHIERIWDVCARHHWNLQNMHLIFIGGGSVILKNEIKKKYPKSVVADKPEYVNAIGFLKCMCRKESVATDK